MKENKGLFIVLDGIDGAGKTTQTELLLNRLEKEGYETGTLDFPRYYDNFFGKMAGEYLSGKFGNTDPRLASLLYALDRWESKDQIERELRAGKIFVCNRYMSANMIHQGGRMKGGKQKQEMMKWLEEMEFGVFKIPKPDLVLYLDVVPKIGQALVDKKSARAYNGGGKRDIHEADAKHLIDARKQALKLVEEKSNWKKIDCMKAKKILPPEEIGEIIWREVAKKIK